MIQDVLQVVNCAESRSLGSNSGPAIRKALPGKHAVFKGTFQPAVLAVQIANLPRTHAHVSGGHVYVGTNVAVQCLHIALAESHHLCIRLTSRVKVTAALAAADGQTGQAVFEDLFKPQELHRT